MDIIVYLFLLLILQAWVYYLSIALDYYFKFKGFRLKKASILFRRSKHCKSKANSVSCVSYWFQIFNYFFVFVYLVIAIVDSFVQWKSIIFFVNITSLLIYAGITLIALLVFGMLTLFIPSNEE